MTDSISITKTKFLNANGFNGERKVANRLFNTTDEYTIIGCVVGDFCSYYTFLEVPGKWNTVMFDVPWEDGRREGLRSRKQLNECHRLDGLSCPYSQRRYLGEGEYHLPYGGERLWTH